VNIEIEFLRCDSVEVIAEVTIRPSWFARWLLRRPDSRRFARRVIGTWVWDDTGARVWSVARRDSRIDAALEATYYRHHEHPKRVAFAEAHRRVNPDGTLRSLEIGKSE
jgi:hypothetical protein